MYRCSVCDQTSEGRYSSNPMKRKRGLKFFHLGNGLTVCSECEYPVHNVKKDMEEGELELLEDGFDE